MNAADGSGLIDLSANSDSSDDEPRADDSPSWSPDGTKIAFTRGLFPGEIWVMNVDRSGLTRLTDTHDTHGVYKELTNLTPEWSPDGTKITFTSKEENGDDEVYVMNAADGSGLIDLSNNETSIDHDPIWSPDGTKIAFTSTYPASNGDKYDFDIYVMNAADGSGLTRLIH